MLTSYLVHLQACLCLVGLWVAGVLRFLAGIFKKRNTAAANVVLPGSGTKETPSQRALARLKPEPLAAGDLDPPLSSGASGEFEGWRRQLQGGLALAAAAPLTSQEATTLAAVVIALEAAAKAIETAMDTMMVAAQRAAARAVAV